MGNRQGTNDHGLMDVNAFNSAIPDPPPKEGEEPEDVSAYLDLDDPEAVPATPDPADDGVTDQFFTGFDTPPAENSEVAELRAEIAKLREAMSQGNRSAGEIIPQSPEEFQELMRTDPKTALTLVVKNVMTTQGLMPPTKEEVEETAVNASRNARSKEEFREIIAERFNPAVNKELKALATQIYQSRKFNVRTNPRAELDAFLIAAAERPDLAPMPTGKMTTRNTTRKGVTAPPSNVGTMTMKLTSEDLGIAQRMGINTDDPKAIKRLATLKSHYNSRKR